MILCPPRVWSCRRLVLAEVGCPVCYLRPFPSSLAWVALLAGFSTSLLVELFRASLSCVFWPLSLLSVFRVICFWLTLGTRSCCHRLVLIWFDELGLGCPVLPRFSLRLAVSLSLCALALWSGFWVSSCLLWVFGLSCFGWLVGGGRFPGCLLRLLGVVGLSRFRSFCPLSLLPPWISSGPPTVAELSDWLSGLCTLVLPSVLPTALRRLLPAERVRPPVLVLLSVFLGFFVSLVCWPWWRFCWVRVYSHPGCLVLVAALLPRL